MVNIVEKWIRDNFESTSTKDVYRSALSRFQREILGGRSFEGAIQSYKEGRRNPLRDLQRFYLSFQNKPTKTRSTYVCPVKMFLAENGVRIDEGKWKISQRRLRRSVKGTKTIDDAPTVPQLKSIMSNMNLKGRSLTLFLASSGSRIGETLQLTLDDLHLEADPPRATIRDEYTKFGEGGRVVFMSYEARDAIADWIRMRGRTAKKFGGSFKSPRVWNITSANVRFVFNHAVALTGLEKRDSKTGRRVLHLHSLRKFFRSNIELPVDVVHALMGHKGYLDRAYSRMGVSKLAKMYSGAMAKVSVYSAPPSRRSEIKKFVAMSGVSLEELIQTLAEMRGNEGLGGGNSLKPEYEMMPLEEYIFTLDDEEVGGLIRRTLSKGFSPEGRRQQKVVPEDDLEKYLQDGWRYVSSLNNGSHKCVVEKV